MPTERPSGPAAEVASAEAGFRPLLPGRPASFWVDVVLATLMVALVLVVPVALLPDWLGSSAPLRRLEMFVGVPVVVLILVTPLVISLRAFRRRRSAEARAGYTTLGDLNLDNLDPKTGAVLGSAGRLPEGAEPVSQGTPLPRRVSRRVRPAAPAADPWPATPSRVVWMTILTVALAGPGLVAILFAAVAWTRVDSEPSVVAVTLVCFIALAPVTYLVADMLRIPARTARLRDTDRQFAGATSFYIQSTRALGQALDRLGQRGASSGRGLTLVVADTNGLRFLDYRTTDERARVLWPSVSRVLIGSGGRTTWRILLAVDDASGTTVVELVSPQKLGAPFSASRAQVAWIARRLLQLSSNTAA